MQKLPDFKDFSTFKDNQTSSTISNLNKTEEVLKRLLVNIEAFKKIENENIRLRKNILDNQTLLKDTYRKKLQELNYAVKEKDTLKDKIKAELLGKYKSYLEKMTKELISEKEENNFLRKKYKELFTLAKKTSNDNIALKTLLQQNRRLFKLEFEKRYIELSKGLKEKELLNDAKHKSLIREYEETKIELNKRHLLEKEKNAYISKKYEETVALLEKREKEFKKLYSLNHKIIQRLAFLEKKSLANENVLKLKTDLFKEEFEKKLREILKIQLDKEVGYQTKIETLTKDLSKYYEELKNSKLKYYQREKELKEKLKQILN